jgi:hypothetical protein
MSKVDKREIFVVGYPKSGNTWLSRLLGDLLDSPIKSRDNKLSIGDEGYERSGKYVIRQEHLDKKKYNGETPIILIVRDPRDVAVSAWKYWGRPSLLSTINNMREGTWPIPHGGGWSEFYEFWLKDDRIDYLVHYEELLDDTASVMNWLLSDMKFEAVNDMRDVVERQSFSSRKKIAKEKGDLLPYGKAVQNGFLRRGISGDWKNYFKFDTLKMAHEYFGETAEKFGYII